MNGQGLADFKSFSSLETKIRLDEYTLSNDVSQIVHRIDFSISHKLNRLILKLKTYLNTYTIDFHHFFSKTIIKFPSFWN